MILKIQHRVSYRNGVARLVRANKPVYVKVGQTYIGNRVRPVGSLDVWEVRKSKDSKAQLETVA